MGMMGPRSLDRLPVHIARQRAHLPRGCSRQGPRWQGTVHIVGLAGREHPLKHSTGQQRACLASRCGGHGVKRQGPGLHWQWGSQQSL